jgi:hypothetical protein
MNQPAARGVHQNSVAAYREEEGKLGRRAATILNWVTIHGRATDRQIMLALRFSEPNSVRPRITELVSVGELVEVGTVRCPVTGKRVRVVDIPRPGQRELFA